MSPGLVLGEERAQPHGVCVETETVFALGQLARGLPHGLGITRSPAAGVAAGFTRPVGPGFVLCDGEGASGVCSAADRVAGDREPGGSPAQ
ncbi:MAG: hypothetical protein P0120_05480 [Nitrospira sp.]|nr:hypothetical protein [Nitrospira sp.]